MTMHEQFADDLSLYALGALQGEERLALEKHLQDCFRCRRELEQVRGDLALLAFSASGPVPPSHSRDRLMPEIAKEPRRAQVRPQKRSWWPVWASAAAAVVLAIVVVLTRQNIDLRKHLLQIQANSARQQQQLLEARELIKTFTSSETERYVLVAAKTPPQMQGKAMYSRREGNLIFLASNMPELPQHKTYELWLIPASGAPIPAGTFKPDSRGSAVIVKPQLPIGVEAKTFAITVEPEPGSSAPTSQPIMVGRKG